MSAPVNQFVFDGTYPDPLAAAMPLELFVSVVFVIAASLVGQRLIGEFRTSTVWIASALGGFLSVLATCGLAEMFSYSLQGDMIPTIPIWGSVSAVMVGIGILSGWINRNRVDHEQ